MRHKAAREKPSWHLPSLGVTVAFGFDSRWRYQVHRTRLIRSYPSEARTREALYPYVLSPDLVRGASFRRG